MLALEAIISGVLGGGGPGPGPDPALVPLGPTGMYDSCLTWIECNELHEGDERTDFYDSASRFQDDKFWSSNGDGRLTGPDAGTIANHLTNTGGWDMSAQNTASQLTGVWRDQDWGHSFLLAPTSSRASPGLISGIWSWNTNTGSVNRWFVRFTDNLDGFIFGIRNASGNNSYASITLADIGIVNDAWLMISVGYDSVLDEMYLKVADYKGSLRGEVTGSHAGGVYASGTSSTWKAQRNAESAISRIAFWDHPLTTEEFDWINAGNSFVDFLPIGGVFHEYASTAIAEASGDTWAENDVIKITGGAHMLYREALAVHGTPRLIHRFPMGTLVEHKDMGALTLPEPGFNPKALMDADTLSHWGNAGTGVEGTDYVITGDGTKTSVGQRVGSGQLNFYGGTRQGLKHETGFAIFVNPYLVKTTSPAGSKMYTYTYGGVGKIQQLLSTSVDFTNWSQENSRYPYWVSTGVSATSRKTHYTYARKNLCVTWEEDEPRPAYSTMRRLTQHNPGTQRIQWYGGGPTQNSTYEFDQVVAGGLTLDQPIINQMDAPPAADPLTGLHSLWQPGSAASYGDLVDRITGDAAQGGLVGKPFNGRNNIQGPWPSDTQYDCAINFNDLGTNQLLHMQGTVAPFNDKTVVNNIFGANGVAKSFSYFAWVKPMDYNSAAANQHGTIMDVGGAGTGWELRLSERDTATASQSMSAFVQIVGSGGTGDVRLPTGSYQRNKWLLICLTFDHTTNELVLMQGQGTQVISGSAIMPAGTIVAAPSSTSPTTTVNVAREWWTKLPGWYGQFGLYEDRAIDLDTFKYIYNGGKGLSFAKWRNTLVAEPPVVVEDTFVTDDQVEVLLPDHTPKTLPGAGWTEYLQADAALKVVSNHVHARFAVDSPVYPPAIALIDSGAADCEVSCIWRPHLTWTSMRIYVRAIDNLNWWTVSFQPETGTCNIQESVAGVVTTYTSHIMLCFDEFRVYDLIVRVEGNRISANMAGMYLEYEGMTSHLTETKQGFQLRKKNDTLTDFVVRDLS